MLPKSSGLFILSGVVLGALVIVMTLPATVGLLNWLTYNPQACASFSDKDIANYVVRAKNAGGKVCSIDRAGEWSNENPVNVLICDKERRTVKRAEVYPDCGLEWR